MGMKDGLVGFNRSIDCDRSTVARLYHTPRHLLESASEAACWKSRRMAVSSPLR